MPRQEALYHMKRCVDSGLWLPDTKAKELIDEASTKVTGETPSAE